MSEAVRKRRLPAAEQPMMEPLVRGPARHFMMRQRRFGPLVPARLWWCNYEPGVPENTLDRGNLSWYPRADIAGNEVDPLLLRERMAWPTSHWKYCQTITETEYRYQFQRIRWAERNRPDDQTLAPTTPVQLHLLPLPNFDRENAL